MQSLRRAAQSAAPSIKNVAQTFTAETGVTGAGFIAPFGVRHASRQILQQRMKSVGNIAKITSAMKMVAASRLRGAQTRVEASRGIWIPGTKLMGDVPDVDVPGNLTVAITSDRGLCGGINTTVAKITRATMGAIDVMGQAEDKTNSLIIMGDKGKALSKEYSNQIPMVIADWTKIPVTFTTTSLIADEILKNKPDVTRVVFNQFKSAMSFLPTVSTVMSAEVAEKRAEAGGMMDEYEIEEEDRAPLLMDLSEFQLAAVLYNSMLENQASELGSRMSAMDSSTKNANDMLQKLTLTYNRSRQAAITTELIEIISGAAALEG
jgi:F-type H+-transporting ATPase subunit gamma